MALIQCPECGKEVSSNAPACIGCGAPLPPEKGLVRYSDQEVAVMLSRKHRTNHILHLLLCIPTLGVWAIVWILVAISNAGENSRIEKNILEGKQDR